jgi:hypothetical protein
MRNCTEAALLEAQHCQTLNPRAVHAHYHRIAVCLDHLLHHYHNMSFNMLVTYSPASLQERPG